MDWLVIVGGGIAVFSFGYALGRVGDANEAIRLSFEDSTPIRVPAPIRKRRMFRLYK
jgi:hypothetical protein